MAVLPAGRLSSSTTSTSSIHILPVLVLPYPPRPMVRVKVSWFGLVLPYSSRYSQLSLVSRISLEVSRLPSMEMLAPWFWFRHFLSLPNRTIYNMYLLFTLIGCMYLESFSEWLTMHALCLRNGIRIHLSGTVRSDKKVDVAFLHRSAKSVYGFKSVKTYRQISYFQNAIRHIHHTLILQEYLKWQKNTFLHFFELFEHIFFL